MGRGDAALGEASLPVKFATSLLKDKDGVIDLDIPVTGSLDDPKLRIGPIVWQIFKNLIVKAVTAPFALFGAMFKGAEDAQFVDFAPGSSEIEASGVERLVALGKGLGGASQRLAGRSHWRRHRAGPAGAGAAAATKCSWPLRRDAVGKGKGDADAPVPALDTLEPKKQIEVLTALVRQQTGAPPQIPEPPAPPEGTSRGDAKAMREAAAIEYLQKSARDGVTVKQEDLAALGEARAASIQHALLTDTGLEPTRVFLTREGKVTTEDGKIRFELGLK